MRKILFLLFAAIVSISLIGQTNIDKSVLSVLETRGEVFIQFDAQPSELADFSRILSIDSYNGETVYAYANQKQFDRFVLIGKKFSLVESYYSRDKALNMATTVAQMLNWDKYPTYDVYVEMMQTMAADNSEICMLDTIGYTTDGRLLLVLKISDNVNVDEAEPEFLYSGQIHGDEVVGGMMFLRLADYLLTNYGTNTQVTNLVDNLQIYICPLANPDGTFYGGNNDISGSRRNNAQDIDLNRNYPDALAGVHPDGEAYGTETTLFIEFAEQRNFVMGGNSHSGAEVMNYPYDTYSTLPADDDWWNYVCREYADNAHAISPSYLTDLDNGVTNGYAWYSITGGRQDYMNCFQSCREVTMELSASKLLDSDELPAHWNYNRQAMLDYLEQATFGLRGIVTDSITHEPLEAMVFVNDHDYLNSQVFSFPLYGDYYRYLFQGDYSVTFSAPGYKSKTINVNITNYTATFLDVELVNLETVAPTANFISNTQNVECNPQIQFINTSEASASTVYLWDFGDGTSTSSVADPIHVYNSNGSYTVKLFAQNEHGEDSLVRSEYIVVNFSQLEDVSDYIICEASGSVNAEYITTGDLYWYYNLNDASEFQIGQTYTTPVLTESTSYYIQEVNVGPEYTGGEPDNSDGGSYVTDNNYLIFNCTQECLLNSVKVYAQGAGNRTITLRNSDGGLIYSEEFYIENGLQTVNLNFNLPVETGLRLGCSSTLGLYRGATGIFSSFSYPYNIGGIVSITQSNVVWWNDGNRYYAYFYDWQLKMPDCYSERTPLDIFVNQNPVAGFNYSVSGNGYASFTNTSVAADSYLWDFGDETSSTEINPNHQYSQDGSYTVKLTATSSCGSQEFTVEINVNTGINLNNFQNISIYPNPTTGIIFIESDIDISTLKVIDITGKIIVEKSEISSAKYILDIAALQSGIYFIEAAFLDNTKSITKLTKN